MPADALEHDCARSFGREAMSRGAKGDAEIACVAELNRWMRDSPSPAQVVELLRADAATRL
eukprot:985223-Pyramimonas_sp.AAC.1